MKITKECLPSLVYQLFLVLIASTILMVGCNKSPSSSDNNLPKISLIKMDGDAVRRHVEEQSIFSNNGCEYVVRAEYYIPTMEWIQKKLVPTWFDFRNKNNIMYDVNNENCQDFSFYCHLAAQKIEKDYGVAVGVFFYKPDITAKIGHSINIILVNDNNELKVVFFDPQTSQIVNLSKTELASCSLWFF